MKKFIFIMLLCIPFFSKAQSSFELSLYGKAISNIRSELSYSMGPSLEWQPRSGKLGLNYSLRFGNDETNKFVFQCPIGLFTGLIAVACLDDDILSTFVGAALCFIPEGISYNIQQENNNTYFIVAPYINPLLLDFSKDGVYPVIEIGTKIKIPMGKATAAIDFSAQSKYNPQVIKPSIGLSLGWKF
ncbi:MAG: hypothetical protein MJ197_03765 [Bacteroidales bacterium]|nr:hypothetical protein [Bacteroidales bacterium]